MWNGRLGSIPNAMNLHGLRGSLSGPADSVHEVEGVAPGVGDAVAEGIRIARVEADLVDPVNPAAARDDQLHGRPAGHLRVVSVSDLESGVDDRAGRECVARLG